MGEFTDAAVSGADPIEKRRGFAELLDKIEGNGVRTVIVEDASRFARELMTQELGILALIQRGVSVLTANGDNLTDSTDPSRKMMRQIAGAFHEYEKARLVAKLKAARDRKRAAGARPKGGRAGRKSTPSWSRKRSGCGAGHLKDTNDRCVTLPPSWRNLVFERARRRVLAFVDQVDARGVRLTRYDRAQV